MSTIFPLREKVSLDDGREPRLVDLDDDVADEVFKALSSGTTREIFSELHQSPQTASDLADVTDTSVQNTQYHLEKLADADLVEVVDTWYSERGTEMKVYAPTDESLVLFAGNDKRSSLRALLKRLVGILAMLLPASAVVAFVARQLGGQPATEPAGPGSDPAPAPATDTPMPTESGDSGTFAMTEGGQTVNNTTATPTSTPAESGQAVVDSAGAVDPALIAGGAFFLGGLFVLTSLAVWYVRR